MKIKIDKLVAVGGSGLLGYYMGLSIFQGIFWRWLMAVLPPINDRNLPRNYTGFLGFSIAAALCYIAYTWFVERQPVAKNKRQYFYGTAALLLLPTLLLFAFRLHAIGFVRAAEATTPTELGMRYQQMSAGFSLTDSSAIFLGKSVELRMDEEYLAELGKGIQAMKIENIIERGEMGIRNPEATLWLSYDYNGRWYSKIISKYDNGFFESIGGGRQVLYGSEALEAFMHRLNIELGDINSFTEAKVYHTSLIEGAEFKEIEAMSESELGQLKEEIKVDNRYQPDNEIVEAFSEIINERDYIDRNQTHLYVIALKRQIIDNNRSLSFENFILYDDNLKLAFFNGEFYKFDIGPLLKEYIN